MRGRRAEDVRRANGPSQLGQLESSAQETRVRAGRAARARLQLRARRGEHGSRRRRRHRSAKLGKDSQEERDPSRRCPETQ